MRTNTFATPAPRALAPRDPQTIEVLDDSRAKELPTGYVAVTAPEGATDAELADAAGYCSRHFGFHVSRYGDGTAVVALFND